MDESQIGFGWGGCGNLITHCLRSNSHYNLICDYYTNIHLGDTWTNQEWNIRAILGPTVHNSGAAINLVWSNSLDTSFHYIIKNIDLNHISGPILDRVSRVIRYNTEIQQTLKTQKYVVLDEILSSASRLHLWCSTIDQTLNRTNITHIYNLWVEKTSMFYQHNSEKVLGYFSDLGIDYYPTILYNTLYANSNIRQQQF